MIPTAYLNGKPISVPAYDPETESIDICANCCRTFVVGKHQAISAACTQTPCELRPYAASPRSNEE